MVVRTKVRICRTPLTSQCSVRKGAGGIMMMMMVMMIALFIEIHRNRNELLSGNLHNEGDSSHCWKLDDATLQVGVNGPSVV